MKYFWIVKTFASIMAMLVQAQQPVKGSSNVTVRVVITNGALDEGTEYKLERSSNVYTVVLSPLSTINLKKVLPAILADIASKAATDKLIINGSPYVNSYKNFYANFGRNLTYDDLFGQHSTAVAEDFLDYLLVKFQATAANAFAGPLANEFNEIRRRLFKMLTIDEVIGLFNGNYLRSFHQKARKFAKEVMVDRPAEIKLVVAALFSIEDALATTQPAVKKLLEILRKVHLL